MSFISGNAEFEAPLRFTSRCSWMWGIAFEEESGPEVLFGTERCLADGLCHRQEREPVIKPAGGLYSKVIISPQ